jgi:glycosyltransferase involved in cell wall biosynthesis
MRVLIQQPRLPHYRAPLMRRIVQLHGWDLTLVYTPRAGTGESGIEVRASSDACWKTVHLPLRTYHLGSLRLNYQQGLLRMLRAEPWDAVFLEGAVANFSGYLAARWCRRHRIPCIWWTKGYFVPIGAVKRWLLRLQLREPHAFLPYGDTTHEFLKQNGVRAEQIVRAYNTVDIETIVACREMLQQRGREWLAKAGWQEKRPIIATVGRLIPTKRVDELLHALKLLAQNGQEFYGIVIGDGSEREALESLARELGLEQQVYFTGRVPEDDDAAILSVADVAVFCGALGLAINQAMALGTPVVVADLPGPDGEMVIHGETGWRYRQGYVDQLAERLQAIVCNDSGEIIRVIQQALHEILQKRSLTAYANAFGEAVLIGRRLL